MEYDKKYNRKYYRTKKELLESLGKKGDDTRSYDRMLSRGEVGHNDDGYYVNDQNEELRARVNELEEMNKKYEKSYNKNLEDYNRLLDEFNEYKRKYPVKNYPVEENKAVGGISGDLLLHLEYLYNRIIACNIFRDEVVQQFYNKNQKEYDFDGAKEKCYQQFKYVEDLEEAQELEFILGILEGQEH